MPECFKVVCIPCKALYKCSAQLYTHTDICTEYTIILFREDLQRPRSITQNLVPSAVLTANHDYKPGARMSLDNLQGVMICDACRTVP